MERARRAKVFSAICGCCLILLSSGIMPAQTWPGIEKTEITWPDAKLSYELQFNRNELVGCEIQGERIIALTRAGALLAFDSQTFKLLREGSIKSGYTALGLNYDGTLVAGTSDGRIDQIDANDLSARTIANLDGQVAWLGADHKGKLLLAAIAHRRQGFAFVTFETDFVWNVTARRAYALPQNRYASPSAFFVDTQQKLWIGTDAGEWGGDCHQLDLLTGEMRQVKVPLGVYGFQNDLEGNVIAYGGMLHFTGVSFATSVGPKNTPSEIFEARYDGATTKPAQPVLPITHILRPADDKELIVFSFNDVFATDDSMKTWRRLPSLDLRYVSGRPDAMGSYPALKSPRTLSSKPLRIIAATALDGFVDIREDHLNSQKLPNQLELVDFKFHGTTKDGIIGGRQNARGMYDLVRLQHGKLEPLSIYPPLKPQKDDSWQGAQPVYMTRDEQIYYFDVGYMSGTNVLVRVRDGITSVIANDTQSLFPESIFRTSDGRIWEAGYQTLKLLDIGKWKDISKLPQLDGFTRLIGGNGPWVLLSGSQIALLRDNAPSGPRISVPELNDPDGSPVKVLAAIDRGNQEVLLSTDKGLFRWPIDGPRLLPFNARLPKETKIRSLCVDSHNTLWLGGDGLWFYSENRTTAARGIAQATPAAGGITSIIADPEGGVLAVTSNGIMISANATITATPKPPATLPQDTWNVPQELRIERSNEPAKE